VAHVCEDDGDATSFVVPPAHAVTHAPLQWPADGRAAASKGGAAAQRSDGITPAADRLKTAA
jgi:hypothetical protein